MHNSREQKAPRIAPPYRSTNFHSTIITHPSSLNQFARLFVVGIVADSILLVAPLELRQRAPHTRQRTRRRSWRCGRSATGRHGHSKGVVVLLIISFWSIRAFGFVPLLCHDFDTVGFLVCCCCWIVFGQTLSTWLRTNIFLVVPKICSFIIIIIVVVIQFGTLQPMQFGLFRQHERFRRHGAPRFDNFLNG